jgi:hypothetical protein
MTTTSQREAPSRPAEPTKAERATKAAPAVRKVVKADAAVKQYDENRARVVTRRMAAISTARQAGATYQQIADALGVNRQRAQQMERGL